MERDPHTVINRYENPRLGKMTIFENPSISFTSIVDSDNKVLYVPRTPDPEVEWRITGTVIDIVDVVRDDNLVTQCFEVIGDDNEVHFVPIDEEYDDLIILE